ncbi:cytochrome c [uncultured Cohaesibacter sp.]|uniref:c-type cytochrome n=1 Tax=uncultured Cohaesibacter sp. TaxID=1002546 RepID=UPI00293040A2|nr:cytochrome c [uncultured Cohaesibacter sp.]
MKTYLVVAAALAVVPPIVGSLPVSAHQGATGIVETRMHAMKTIGEAVRHLKVMMADEDDYNADSVREQAKIIRLHAGKKMTQQFPEGSLQDPTHAKAEIWSDWDRFFQLAHRLKDLASGLELAADNGLMLEGQSHMEDMMSNGSPSPDALGQMPADGLVTMMIETCSACHRSFRARKP